MGTDTNLLGKGLIRLGILVFLFIITPIILTMGFKGVNKYSESMNIYFAYVLVTLGILALIFTIYYAFKTFGLIKKAIFNQH